MTGISALTIAEEEGGSQSHQKFQGLSRIVGPQWSHLPTLTVGLLGIQIFWSVEMSYASPYLLSLGLSKSKMAVVFVAGPLSGLVMQPLIGLLADNCTSRFGRRKPYMMIGTTVCIFAMILLGFTRWFASIFTGENNDSNDLLTIWLAVFAIYFIDFSINAIMAVDRALVVDTLPSTQQPQGNAWAAGMGAVGAIVGFFVGNVDLTKVFPFFGKTQLEVLSVVASLVLLGCHLVTAILVKEKILLPSTDITKSRTSFLREMKDMWTSVLTLPRTIRQILIIQFFAWLGWFPVLFYTTIYIGDLYRRVSPVPTTDEAQIFLNAEATRLGSRALFWSSIVSLVANILLPHVVMESASGSRTNEHKPHLRFGYGTRDVWWKRILKLVKAPAWMRIHLANLWALGHFVFAGCMFATFFTSSVIGASFLVTVTGFSWAVTQWAPFALLGTAILTESSGDDDTTIRLSDTRTGRRVSTSDVNVDTDADERNLFLPGEASDSEDEEGNEIEARKEEQRRMLGNSLAQVSRVNIGGAGDGDPMLTSDPGETDLARDGPKCLSAKAGTILGIHNMSIVIPQFLVTGIAALVFAIFDPQNSGALAHHGAPVQAQIPVTNVTDGKVFPTNGTEAFGRAVRSMAVNLLEIRQELEEDATKVYQGSNSVVYIFRFGGITAMIAAVLAWRLARDLRHR